MKKSSYVTLLLGTISGACFALGMCMALLPAWGAFNQGIIMGCTGLLLALITLFVWRKMEHKAPIKITAKTVIAVFVGAIGTLAFGFGLCLTMVWQVMIPGVLIGLAGIFILLALIPLCKGVR